VSLKQAKVVKIVNPRPDGRTHISLNRARRYVNRGEARFDSVGRLEFVAAAPKKPEQRARKLRGGALEPLKVSCFTGCDARPGMPVLPPSPDVLAKMMHRPMPPVRAIADSMKALSFQHRGGLAVALDGKPA
jgi:hypothetical protein